MYGTINIDECTSDLASFPGLHASFCTASNKSWAWRPGNEATADPCQNEGLNFIVVPLSRDSTFGILILPVLLPIQGKLQKHQAFEAEVVANKDRIFSTIAMGQGEDACSGAPIKEINLGIPDSF